MKLEWDEAKNITNQQKHGVSFEEASELLTSERDYLELLDDEHSDLEDRFIAVGPIARGIILVVGPPDMKTSSESSARALRPSESKKCFSSTWSTGHEGRYS